MTDHWSDTLAPLSPCAEAMTYLQTQPDAVTAWNQCERGDWMLWLAGKYAGPPEGEGRKGLVLAACACARLALPHFTKLYPHDGRVLACIETAERWARGEATLAELRQARSAADDAADAAAAADAAYAADAAAYAAAAADAAAYTAAAAAAYAADADAADADAAAYVDAAADAADADAARKKALAACADCVRRFYPIPPTEPETPQ